MSKGDKEMRVVFYDKTELYLPVKPEDMPGSLAIDEFYMFFMVFKLPGRDKSVPLGTTLINCLNMDIKPNMPEELLVQNLFKYAVDYCVNINPLDENLEGLSPIQRLHKYQKYILDERIETLLEPFNIRYQAINLNNNITLAEVVESSESDVSQILYLSLIKMVDHNIYVKKCEYCGKYFLIQGKRKTIKYCDKIPEGKTQPCFALAARQKYEQKLENDSITRAYRSAYKKYHQRVRIGKWDNEDFEKWSTEAKLKLKQVQNSEITEEEFNKWLKGDE